MTSALLELATEHDTVPLLGLPAEQPAKQQLTTTADAVLQNLAAFMDALILDLLNARTRQEFEEGFAASFLNYVRLVRSFTEMIVATMPQQQIGRLSIDSFNQLEADIRLRGQESFGAAMTERALFTVWTLRKITRLLSVVTSVRAVEASEQAKDRDFARNFLVHALVARFGVDCLVVAMKHNKTIYPEVLEKIDDQLRSVVDAYSWVQQSAQLRARSKSIDSVISLHPLDDDDKQLLRESMQDLAFGEM